MNSESHQCGSRSFSRNDESSRYNAINFSTKRMVKHHQYWALLYVAAHWTHLAIIATIITWCWNSWSCYFPSTRNLKSLNNTPENSIVEEFLSLENQIPKYSILNDDEFLVVYGRDIGGLLRTSIEVHILPPLVTLLILPKAPKARHVDLIRVPINWKHENCFNFSHWLVSRLNKLCSF